MQLFREYETVALLHPDTLDDSVQRFNHKVQDVVGREKGVLLKVESWGKKKLAYEVKKETKGVYTYFRYLGGAQLVAELERVLRYTDNCLRYQTVFLADRVQESERVVDDSAKTDFIRAAEEAAKVAAEQANRPAQAEAEVEAEAVPAAAIDGIDGEDDEEEMGNA